MIQRRAFLSLGSLFLTSKGLAASYPNNLKNTKIDSKTARLISKLTAIMPEKKGSVERFAIISQSFLNTPYRANNLIGSATQAERLVIDLRSVDCLTFIEYITALNKSTHSTDFIQELVSTRYKNNTISFSNRRNFFTDWSCSFPRLGKDITHLLSSKAITVSKILNQKSNGDLYLPGLLSQRRFITYVPGNIIKDVLPLLHAGDMIGIYTHQDGLDVTHTGTVIKKNNRFWFRNASSLSKNRCVIDSELQEYVIKKPGIIVIRPFWKDLKT